MSHRLERWVQANTEVLDRVVGALNALEKTIQEAKESVDGEEEEGEEDKRKSKKAKGKRKEKEEKERVMIQVERLLLRLIH